MLYAATRRRVAAFFILRIFVEAWEMKDKLNFKVLGEGEPIIIMHGLFGMLDNWKTFGRLLSEDYMVILIDLRNHGRSAHLPEHGYDVMAEDIIEFMEKYFIASAHFIGHSMGGKVAMELALNHTDKVESLVVVDIAPEAYKGGHQLIIDSLQKVPIKTLNSRTEASDLLLGEVGDIRIVQFLLKNLKRNKESAGYSWKFNLEVLVENYLNILGAIESDYTFSAKTTFVKGELSAYISDKRRNGIKALFPEASIVEVEGAGHWVHADNSNKLLEIVRKHMLN